MPVVGFHQARRPRQTRAERLRRDLSWPRPGGILVALAGAALVFAGALTLSPSEGQPSGAAASSLPRTTPDTSTVSVPPAASPPADTPETAPATLAPSDISRSAIPAPGLIAGASPDSAIETLFAAGEGSPTDLALLDITNPASPLVIANKHRPLVPEDYAPADLVIPAVPSASAEAVRLRAEAAGALENMFAAAAAEGVSINVKSSYRSYETQFSLYNGYVATKGTAEADTTSARPGFSEHQTGLAVDIGDAAAGTACDFNSCFADTPAAKWVAAHGSDYGFIVRYGPGEEAMTGYLPEPWHLRYLGVGVARDMAGQGIHSYEHYLGLPGAPGYK